MSIPPDERPGTKRLLSAEMSFVIFGGLLYAAYSFLSRWADDQGDTSRWSWLPAVATVAALICIIGAATVAAVRLRVAHVWKVNHIPLGYYPLERPSTKVRRLRAAQRVLIVSGLVLVFGDLIAAGVVPDEVKLVVLVGVLVGVAAVLASIVVTFVRLSIEAQGRYDKSRR